MLKNGRVKLSRTFPTLGQFAMGSIAVRAGKGRPVEGRPFIITAVAKRYQGSFGGEHTSGTSWNGSLTYFYQQGDPVTNQPWSDGDVHYVGVEGSVTWRFDASVLNADTGVIGRARRNCAADPRTGQIPLDSLDATMTVAREVERAKGRRYRLSVFVQEAPRPPVHLRVPRPR